MDKKRLSRLILRKTDSINKKRSTQAIKILILLAIILIGFSACQPDKGTNGTTGATSENTIGGQHTISPIMDLKV